jgi:hypothetical protein
MESPCGMRRHGTSSNDRAAFDKKKARSKSGLKSISKEETWRRQMQYMQIEVIYPIFIGHMSYSFCEYLKF